jgi:hypothetical protein
MSDPELKVDANGFIQRTSLLTEEKKRAYLIARDAIQQLRSEMSSLTYESSSLGTLSRLDEVAALSAGLGVVSEIVATLDRANKILSGYNDIAEYGLHVKRQTYGHILNSALDTLAQPDPAP